MNDRRNLGSCLHKIVRATILHGDIYFQSPFYMMEKYALAIIFSPHANVRHVQSQGEDSTFILIIES